MASEEPFVWGAPVAGASVLSGPAEAAPAEWTEGVVAPPFVLPVENRSAPVEAVTAPERLAGLDALRGGAMLLGIFIHSAISYMPTTLADLLWGVREPATSWYVDRLFWWVHFIRLPLFFVLSGYFAARVQHTRGTGEFLAHRWKRLAVPFVVGIALLLPVGYLYGWACGVLNRQVYNPKIIAFEIAPSVRAELFGPGHLWFLEDLFLISIIFACFCRVRGMRTLPAGRAATWPAWVSLLAPLLLALPTAFILWADDRPVMAHHNTFIPDLSKLVYYGYFFAAGVALYRCRTALATVFAWPTVHIGLSLAAAAVALLLVDGRLAGRKDWTATLAFQTTVAVLAWLSVFGYVGLALRCFRGRNPATTYLADASYWLYLIHIPLVCLLQMDLLGLPLPPEIKCVLCLVFTTALGFASYHTLVRFTVLGRWLHGPRARRA